MTTGVNENIFQLCAIVDEYVEEHKLFTELSYKTVSELIEYKAVDKIYDRVLAECSKEIRLSGKNNIYDMIISILLAHKYRLLPTRM